MTSSTSPGTPGQFCAACGSALAPGARFCHRCGTPFGHGMPLVRTPAGSPMQSALPWGVAFVALLALVAMFAGRNFGAAKGSAIGGSANSLPTQALDGAAAQGGAMGSGSGGAAPSIANLSPQERASRLYIRIMTYAERGFPDSVAFFAPMALGAHEMLESPTLDERYHHGLIAEVAGNPATARAQADTILSSSNTNLLGLMLAARAARMNKDETAARAFDQRFLAALDNELRSGNQDYELHRAEIDRAAREARGAR